MGLCSDYVRVCVRPMCCLFAGVCAAMHGGGPGRVDHSKYKIASVMHCGLNNKEITTTEPEIQSLLSDSTRIDFTTDNDKVIQECDIIFTLVATPSLDDGSYDVSNVDDVVSDFQRLGWKTKDSLIGKSLVVGCTTNPGDCDICLLYTSPSPRD